MVVIVYFSFAETELEPEQVEPRLLCRTGTGAIISYFGSGSTALEPKLPFYKYFTLMSSVGVDARI